jgi:hypothetical protein
MSQRRLSKLDLDLDLGRRDGLTTDAADVVLAVAGVGPLAIEVRVVSTTLDGLRASTPGVGAHRVPNAHRALS